MKLKNYDIETILSALCVMAEKNLFSRKHNGSEMNQGMIDNASDLLQRIEKYIENEDQKQLAKQDQQDANQWAMLQFCSDGV